MVWVKVDDDFPQHPKARKAGAVGMALWLAGLCYSSHYLTDGLVPVEALAGLLPLQKKELTKTIDILVFAGLWSIAEGGYEIHDYLDYQPPRAQILAERQAAKDRMKARRSGNVQANKTRSSGEVREKFSDPTPTPEPTPVPPEESSSAPSAFEPTKKRQPKRTRIIPGWEPNPKLLAEQSAEHPAANMTVQVKTFRNHHQAKGSLMVDWDAAFRTWMGRSEEFAPHSAGLATTNGNGHRSQNQINADAVARRMGYNPADTDPFGTAPDEPWRTL